MSTTTVPELLSGSTALLVDCRNAVFPFVKDTFVFARRYLGAGVDYATADTAVLLDLDGVTEVLTCQITHDASGTFTYVAPTTIAYTTTAGAKKTVITIPNTSATALHVFIVAKV
ncbi:MAG: hypothetical protein WC974_08925 [Thermoplasmata archaeon]